MDVYLVDMLSRSGDSIHYTEWYVIVRVNSQKGHNSEDLYYISEYMRCA